jgi:hypothetical protein
MPIPVAARSKAWVCGRSLGGIAGSNPQGTCHVSLVCCQVQRSLRRGDPSSRGVQPSVCVIECDQVQQ